MTTTAEYLASGTLSTPIAGDNSTKLATTAFVTTAVSTLAPKASPTFTGTPVAPTPISSDNSTTIATTAFVKSAVPTNTTAKAWVNFDGSLTGTITPRASYNVTSVTKNGTGDYTLNFTNAMADANYVISGSATVVDAAASSVVFCVRYATTPTASSCNIYIINPGVAAKDSTRITAVINGN